MAELGDVARAAVERLRALGFDLSAVLEQDPRDNREPGWRIACSGCDAYFREDGDRGPEHGEGCPRTAPDPELLQALRASLKAGGPRG